LEESLKKLVSVLFATSFFFSSAEAFTLISNKGRPAFWVNHKASYRFNTATSGYFVGGVDASGTSSDEFEPLRKSFNTWTSMAGLDIKVTETTATSSPANSDDHLNTLQWVKAGWRDLSFKPPSNALAVTLLSFDSDTGAIVDADIYFNADSFKWAVVDAATEHDYVDVQNVATHEIGHFLGLDHSSENLFEEDLELKDATMFFASTMAETAHRDLHNDDIKAIQALYGTGHRATPTITSAEVLSSVSGTVKYVIKGSGFNEYTSFVMSKKSASEADVPARYRTINSADEATAEFDLLGMSGGNARMIAFNDPEHLTEFSLNISSVALGATETGGGGGGCALQISGNFSGWLCVIGLLAALSVLRLRGRLARLERRRSH
jgi:hypothetical protein